MQDALFELHDTKHGSGLYNSNHDLIKKMTAKEGFGMFIRLASEKGELRVDKKNPDTCNIYSLESEWNANFRRLGRKILVTREISDAYNGIVLSMIEHPRANFNPSYFNTPALEITSDPDKAGNYRLARYLMKIPYNERGRRLMYNTPYNYNPHLPMLIEAQRTWR